MTISIKHNFQLAKADDSVAAAGGQVVPSKWNEEHSVLGVCASDDLRLSDSRTPTAHSHSDLGTPTFGNLTNCTKDGTNGIGYLNIPQNIQSTYYTCVLADAGKHIVETTASTALNIPANASVAYPNGTALTFVNDSTGEISIAITTDTMTLANTTTTGTRTLARNGIATALKIGTNRWLISGTGLT